MVNLVASFYKYVAIDNPMQFRDEQFGLCGSLNLKGRILIGKEGINGSVYGASENIEKYKQELRANPLFSGMDFKEQETQKKAFGRLYVSFRKEIVRLGFHVDLRNTAPFLTPKELKEWIDNNEDMVLLDMRNDYEANIGKFRNARTLNIGNFRDLPKAVNEINDLKGKKIVTYCTGGIRCEKASAFLIENGFSNVWQLKGGILDFGKEFPDTYWEGKCFVFDDRIAIDLNRKKSDFLAACELCGNKSEDYINCHNLDCDKLFSCCNECRIKFNASCSEECSSAPKRRKKNVQSYSNNLSSQLLLKSA